MLARMITDLTCEKIAEIALRTVAVARTVGRGGPGIAIALATGSAGTMDRITAFGRTRPIIELDLTTGTTRARASPIAAGLTGAAETATGPAVVHVGQQVGLAAVGGIGVTIAKASVADEPAYTIGAGGAGVCGGGANVATGAAVGDIVV